MVNTVITRVLATLSLTSVSKCIFYDVQIYMVDVIELLYYIVYLFHNIGVTMLTVRLMFVILIFFF